MSEIQLVEETNKLLREAEQHRKIDPTESVLEMVRKLTDERKVVYEALSRVQHRCTDLEMERRRLVAEAKKAEAEWNEEREAFKLRNEQLRDDLEIARLDSLKRSK